MTTKAAPFVYRLLGTRGVTVPPGRVYGLGSGPKPDVVAAIRERHGGAHVTFIEDRLATLEAFVARGMHADVRLLLAAWGYNTPAERDQARGSPHITLLDTQADLVALAKQQQ